MEFSRQEYWSGLPFPSPGESSQPRDRTRVSRIAGRRFNLWATREAQRWSSEKELEDKPGKYGGLAHLRENEDFPGGLVAKTLYSQCSGPGFDPWSGNCIPHTTVKTWSSQINKSFLKRERKWVVEHYLYLNSLSTWKVYVQSFSIIANSSPIPHELHFSLTPSVFRERCCKNFCEGSPQSKLRMMHLSPETITTLLFGCTPIQNVFGV